MPAKFLQRGQFVTELELDQLHLPRVVAVFLRVTTDLDAGDSAAGGLRYRVDWLQSRDISRSKIQHITWVE
jgi:hypothetical protein